MSDADELTVRPYRDDRDELWTLKRGFELGLGSGTGGEEKQRTYESKLTSTYRKRWLEWVDRCVEEDPDCVQVAVADGPDSVGGAAAAASARDEPANGTDSSGDGGETARDPDVVGYVFVLPASLAFVWDAAVLNELFVVPEMRGEGVADALMHAALECAREQTLPLDRLVLDVDRENDRARAFYERYGFEHWGEMVARKL